MGYTPKTTVWAFKNKAKLSTKKSFIMKISYRSDSTIVFEVKGKKYCISTPKSLKENPCKNCKIFKAHLIYISKHPKSGTPIYSVRIDEAVRGKYKKEREYSLREAIGDDAYDYGYIPDSQSRGWS